MPVNFASTTSVLALCMLAACQIPKSAGFAEPSSLFVATWNSGADKNEPEFHAQKIDDDTIVLRQSILKTFEAPFLYLIFGEERALLIDTGVGGANLRSEIDSLIDKWLSDNKRKEIALTVMHSHGHGDHVGGDNGFKDRPNTEIVGHKLEDVEAFFSVKNGLSASVKYDLGGRVVDILTTPGHHPAHVMVFDPLTQIMFTGDTIYPGRLYFKCGKLREFSASIDKIANFANTHNVKWFLGGHIEMKITPGELFSQNAKPRKGEHLLELPVSIISEIQSGLTELSNKLVVTEYDEFALVPHPTNPKGKQPPNWCLTDQ